MTIYYSATTNAFYDSQVYNVNNIPEDKVAVAESTYKNLMAQQCAGRVIVAAADGTPTTIAQTCGSCTSTKYATKTELTNGLAAKANDSNAVHKTGNETINGVKSFGDIIKATNGTVQVGADTGYSVTFNYNGNITSKQARGTYNIFLPDANGTLALTSDLDSKANDNNVVHKTGREVIGGDKVFQNTIYRLADITTSTVEEVYRLTDTNATPCGSIYNCMHWYNDNVYNRHQSYNATSGKDMYLEILSHNDGSGVVNTGGSVTNNKNLTTVTNDTGNSYVATMGWVNNPATSTNVVHRSSDETIAGNKTFTDKIISNKELHYTDTKYDWSDTSINTWCDAGHVACFDKTGNRRMHELVGANGGVWRKECYINENQYFSVDSNKNISYEGISFKFNGKNVAIDENLVHTSGDETIAGNKTFSNKIKGDLQGNADTATSAGNGVDSYGGSWIRFKNGIQMCWGGGIFQQTISYAKAFSSNPTVVCTPAEALSTPAQLLVVNFYHKTNTQFACRLWNVNAQDWQSNGYFDWIAIGTW